MFSQLYNSVFPVLGDIFGFLTSFVTYDLSMIYTVFGMRVPFVYQNLFTGVVEYSYLTNKLTETVMRVLYFGVPSNFPFWLATLYNVMRVYISIAMINFVRNVI